MDEGAAKLVNGLCPPMKRLAKFDHFAVSDTGALALDGPLGPVHRRLYQLLAVRLVGDGQEEDDTDHRVEFLPKDSHHLRQKASAVQQIDRFPMLRGTSANLSAKRFERCHASPIAI